MGQMKRKMAIKVSMEEMRERRRNYLASIPIRTVKAIAAAFGFIPLTMVSFAVVCFQTNKWPWSRDL